MFTSRYFAPFVSISCFTVQEKSLYLPTCQISCYSRGNWDIEKIAISFICPRNGNFTRKWHRLHKQIMWAPCAGTSSLRGAVLWTLSTSTSVNTCNCYIFRRIFRTATHINERTFGLKSIGILIQLHYLQSKSEHRYFVIFRRNTDEQYAMICSKTRILTQMFQ